MTTIEWLSLANNKISELHSSTFNNLTSLQELYLHHNNIKILRSTTFLDLTSLVVLYLQNNSITELMPHTFDNLKLIILRLDMLRIQNIDHNMFSNLDELVYINIDRPQFCYHVQDLNKTPTCYFPPSGISSPQHLFDHPVQRIFVWIMGLLSCTANVAVVIYNVFYKQKYNANILCIINLGMSDFLMGIYLLMLAGHDSIFRDVYIIYDLSYMWGWSCQAAGIICMVSSEVSVCILVFMSIDRCLNIAFPFSKASRYLTNKKCVILLCCIWAACLIMASMPVQLIGPADFYGSSGVCFPLYVHYPFSNGWQYSFAILVVLNSLAMIVIAICYYIIFRALLKSKKNVSNQSATVDTTLIRRMVAIVMTDAACWIPIISLKILAICDIYISPTAYGWVSVFVLPINSALNPIIYSAMTHTSVKWIHDQCCASSSVEELVSQ